MNASSSSTPLDDKHVGYDAEHQPREGSRTPEANPWRTQSRIRTIKRMLRKSKHLLIYLLVAGIIAASAAGGWAGYRSDSNKDRFSSEDGGSGDGLILVGQVTSIDLNTLQAVITWEIGATGTYELTDSGDDQFLPNTPLRIYADGSSTPVGYYDPVIAPYNNPQLFSTKSRIVADSTNSATFYAVPSTVKYPLDTYQIAITFGARDGNNNTVPITLSRLIGNIQGWATTTSDAAASYHGADGMQYDQGRGFVAAISRADAIIAFAIIIQAVMWAITLAMVYMAMLGTIFGRIITPALLSVPATVLFALPALRNVMPLAPPFGTYMDVCGLLLNELLVALSFVALLVTHLSRTKFDRFKKNTV